MQPGKFDKYYSPYAVILLRIVVGAVFVISGFAKAVDPWGFIFKIEDYLSAWSMTEPRTITLVLSIALSAYEFIFGFMLLTGCFKRVAPWLLTVSMAFMLPLTAYIWIANPVDDCGCFGEMLKLSNAATFWKNVALTAALIYLCRFNARFRRGIYRPAIQWLAGIVLTLYILVTAMYGYNVQPMVDFRSYPAGTDLYTALGDENGDDAGSDAVDDMMMVYERDGVQQTFSIDELPDSTWTFVKRVERTATVDSEGGFTIYDVDSNDVTSEVISREGQQLILVIPEANRVDIANTYAINEMYKAIKRDGGDMIALIAATPRGIDLWIDISMAEYPCYIVEDTALKQLSRGEMSMVYINDGIIQWKRTLSAFDFATIDALGNDTLSISDIEINDNAFFRLITVITVILLTAIALFQEFILRLLPGKQKKALTLHPDKENTTTKQNKNCKEMRKNIVAGNWKMNTTLAEGVGLAKDVNEALQGFTPNCDVIIAVPFTHLASVNAVIDPAKLGLGAENCADHAKGAYTGEVSAAMVASTGATYVILGHSERRQYYGETSEILKEKVALALDNNLTPIFCIGEVLEERENGTYLEVVKKQIEDALFDMPADKFSKLILAYEPVWAIGTGKTATDDQAEEMHAFIRKVIADKYGNEVAENTSILYGGSCKPTNAAQLFAKPNVDGGLIGGASLDAESFMGIVKAF